MKASKSYKHWLFSPLWLLVGMVAIIVACGGDATATPSAAPTAAPAATAIPAATAVPAATAAPAATAIPAATAVPAATAAPTPTPVVAMEAVQARLRVISGSERENNDPSILISHHMHQLDQVYESLFYDDQFSEYVPNLVTEWSVSPDGKTWDFELRQGVRFHEDWGEFTAADVVQTMEWYTRPANPDPRIEDMKLFLEGHEVVDDHNITFTLPRPFLDGTYLFSGQTNTHILSDAFLDAEGEAGLQEKMIGTGPYQFVERVLGASVLHERVPYEHWRVTPDFEELEFFFVFEPSTILSMLLANEVDIGILPFDLQTAAVDGGLEIVKSTSPAVVVYAWFGGNYVPTADYYEADNVPVWALPDGIGRKVRKALNLAVDRQEIQNTLLGGRGAVMPVAFYAEHLRGWDPSWIERFEVDYRYDPEHAKELLAEVEAELGEPIDWSEFVFLLTPRASLGSLVDIGEAVANYWHEIDVPIRIDQREFVFFMEKMLAGDIEGVAWADATPWRSTDTEQLKILYVSKAKGGCCNMYENQFIEDRYDEFLATVSLDERDRLMREIGEHLFVEYASLPLFSFHSEYVINPEVVAGYETSGLRPPRHLEYVTAVKK